MRDLSLVIIRKETLGRSCIYALSADDSIDGMFVFTCSDGTVISDLLALSYTSAVLSASLH